MSVSDVLPRPPEDAPVGRSPAPAGTRFAGALGLLAAASVPAGIVLTTSSASVSQGLRVVLAVLALATAGAAALILVSRGRRVGHSLRTFRLGPWWVAYFVVTFGLNSLAWIDQQGESAAVIHQSVVPIAVLMCTAALLCWTVGYLAGPPQAVSRWLRTVVSWAAPQGQWTLRTPRFALVLYSVGVGARVAQLATGSFAYLADPAAAVGSPSSSNQLFAQVGQCCRFALIVAMIDLVLRPSTRTKLTLAVILLAELGFGLLAGMKSEFMLTVLSLVIVYAIAHMRLPRKVVVGGIVGMLLIVPLNAQYRELVRTDSGVISSGDAARLLPQLVGKTLSPANLPDLIASSPEALAGRLRHIDTVALIIQKTPSVVPHAGWAGLVSAPVYGIVPRAVWHSKPALLSGYRFNQQYRDLPATVYSSDALTFPGDLYRHAGMPAVVIGMVLLGIACRLVEDRFYPDSDLRLILLYVPFFVLFANTETDAVSVIASIIQTFALALVVTKLAFVVKR